MNSFKRCLEIEYLSVDKTLEIENIVKYKFERLCNVCNYILKCKVKVANIAIQKNVASRFLYMVSISITMPEGFDVYTLRIPQKEHTDSVEQAISDVFATIYRKLIELKLESQLQPI